ncbi:MAG TPA: prolyl oligopeptidase family serine peptidase, partial [Gemmatimonadaceae bacterium]|nr:prolyl oligopeptidase family serine peptidase [Gemmatimonadaceae bacterium]
GDLAGVHLYGNSLDTTAMSYQSSAISAIDKWKSPVFLVQGDDDRNVDFAQMVGLVQLLRAHNVYYELTVIPDDTHESLLHARWVDTFDKMGDFFHRFVWDHGAGAQATSSGTR